LRTNRTGLSVGSRRTNSALSPLWTDIARGTLETLWANWACRTNIALRTLRQSEVQNRIGAGPG
jgi:hypothetical protein